MLFSQPELAELMNDRYECVWESLRAAPKVDIDFGNGYRLERTLNGNIATFLLDASGGTFDVVPGLVDPREYRARLMDGLGLYDGLVAAPEPAAFVAEYHRQAPRVTAGRQPLLVPDLRKIVIEYDVKRAVGAVLAKRPARETLPAPTGDGAVLTEDTEFNRTQRYPAVHALLAASPLASPRLLTGPLFKDLLHVDLDDPFLGLAPDVVGGRLGRHGPNGPLDAPLPVQARGR